METIAPVIGSLGFVAFIVGLILFIPVASLKPRRPFAKKLTIGGGVAFVVALLLDPTPSNKPVAVASSATAQSDAAESVRAATRDDRAAANMVASYRAFLAVAKPCDRAVNALADAASAGNQYATFSAAKDGHELCRETAMTVAASSPPDGLDADTRKAAAKAIEHCRDAYLSRQMAMEKAMAIADGDARPSAMVDFTDALKAGQAGLLLCVGEWFGAAGKAGVDPKELS